MYFALLVMLILPCCKLNAIAVQRDAEIFSNGRFTAYLDVPEQINSTDEMKVTIPDFLRCLKAMTEHELPVTGSTHSGRRIPIRLELRGEPHRNTLPAAGDVQGYHINTNKSRILITAHTVLGLQNALYGLLDRWGCRWIMLGPLGEVIPKHTRLALPAGDIYSPKSYDMSVEAGGRKGDVADWWRRNQGGFKFWINGQHYWFYALPPDKYYAQHPEWYALIAGKREPTQLCTTNPEVIKMMIEKAKEMFRSQPTTLAFPMDPQDNTDFCQCDNCRAQDPPGFGVDGNPLMTDRVIRFANAVACGIKDEFPDRVVALYAYLSHTETPVNVRPEPNVAIGITRSQHCILHLTPHGYCKKSVEFYDLVRRWRQITPSFLWVYDYDPISWTGCLPSPTYMERAESLSVLFKKYGIQGGCTDYVPSFTKPYASTYINTYIERRIKADPNRKPKAVLNDMCRSFFGPASASMEKYYLELSKASQSKHSGMSAIGFGLYRYDELFNPRMIAAARKYLNASISQASGHSPFIERVRLVDMSQRYLEAYLDGVWSAKAGNYDKSVAAFARVDTIIDETDRAGAIDVTEARYRLNSIRLKTLAEHFPDKRGMVRDWKLLGPFNNTDRNADSETDSFEPVISIDSPVKLKDGSQLSWKSYHNPSGFLDLENALNTKSMPWKLSQAYAGISVVALNEMSVVLKMNSFCPFVVFVNGKQVFHRKGMDFDSPENNSVNIELVKGRNTIVVKLSQTILVESFPWGLYMRMTDGKDLPILTKRASSGEIIIVNKSE